MGHTISAESIDAMKNKVEAIQQDCISKTQTELRAFLVLASYYMRFVPKFAMIAKPICDLVAVLNKENTKYKKGIIGQIWSREWNEEFNTLKDALTSTPVLSFPNFSLPFILDLFSRFGCRIISDSRREEESTTICQSYIQASGS